MTNPYKIIEDKLTQEGEDRIAIQNFIDDLKEFHLKILIEDEWEYWTNYTFRKNIQDLYCFIDIHNDYYEVYTSRNRETSTSVSPESFYFIENAVEYAHLIAKDEHQHKHRYNQIGKTNERN